MQVVRSMLTKRRLARLSVNEIQMDEILQWLCKLKPISKETDEALRKWTEKLPPRVALQVGLYACLHVFGRQSMRIFVFSQ